MITAKTIENALKGLPEGNIVTFMTGAEKHLEVNTAILDYLVNTKKVNGIYVTMREPYDSLAEILKKKKIDVNKLIIIDAISGVMGKEKYEAENCIVLPGPTSLTDVAIKITETYHSKNIQFLLMDSLSTLLLYNTEAKAMRFTHYLVTKLRKLKLSGIILSLEKEMDKKLIKSVFEFCDKVVKL